MSYNYYCQGECLIGQWVLSIDPTAKAAPGLSSFHYVINGKVTDLDHLDPVANSGNQHWTFGAALQRARRLAAATQRLS